MQAVGSQEQGRRTHLSCGVQVSRCSTSHRALRSLRQSSVRVSISVSARVSRTSG